MTMPVIAKIQWSLGIGDPTWIGWITAIAYLACAVACFWTARRRDPRRAWLALAILYGMLAINKQLDLQTLVTAIGRQISRDLEIYDQRRPLQVAFIMIVAVIGLAACVWFWFQLSSGGLGARIAAIGAVVTVMFVLFRASSFHHVDVLLRIPVGSTTVRGVVENLGPLITATGAFIANAGKNQPDRSLLKEMLRSRA